MKIYFVKIAVLFLILSVFFSDGNKAEASDAFKISVSVTEKSGQDLKDYQILVDLNKDNFTFDSNKERLSFFDEIIINLITGLRNGIQMPKKPGFGLKFKNLRQ